MRAFRREDFQREAMLHVLCNCGARRAAENGTCRDDQDLNVTQTVPSLRGLSDSRISSEQVVVLLDLF